MTGVVKGRAAPELVLCRHCVQYVFAGAQTCPHCGEDARKIGPLYREGGFAAREAMQRIEAAYSRRHEAQTDEPDAA